MKRRYLELMGKGSVIGAREGVKDSLIFVLGGLMLLQVVTITPRGALKAHLIVLAIIPCFAVIGGIIGAIIGLVAAAIADKNLLGDRVVFGFRVGVPPSGGLRPLASEGGTPTRTS
jgi:hypothetical protein